MLEYVDIGKAEVGIRIWNLFFFYGICKKKWKFPSPN